jgi:HD-like signal output (HDOD) protein
MPQVAGRALKLVENPDATAGELTELLSTDTALAARVMKIANSAMFSRQRQITTLNQAIMIIGFKALKGIIVAAALKQFSKNSGKLDQLIWENSMGCAVCATALARKLKKSYVDEIFLLGLMHSLGQVVLLVQAETVKDYPKALAMIKERGCDYVTAEQEVFGFAHPLIGALVAKKWNFSPEACQVILHYRDPVDSDKPVTPSDEKTAVVQLADALTHMAGIGSPEGYPDQRPIALAVGAYLGLDAATMETLFQEVVDGTKEQFAKEKHIYE